MQTGAVVILNKRLNVIDVEILLNCFWERRDEPTRADTRKQRQYRVSWFIFESNHAQVPYKYT